MYPRRGCGRWRPQTYMPMRNFQRDGSDMPQHNGFPERSGPRWGQFYPKEQREYDDKFNNCRDSYRGRGWRHPRGYFHEKHHYRGHSYRGPKRSFSKGSYQYASRSPCLVDITPNKKENHSEKMEAHTAISKKTEQGKEDSPSSVKKSDSPKVDLKATNTIISPSEFSFRLTESSTYPQNKEEMLSKKKEESKLMKDRNSEAAEGSANQTQPIPSPVEEQITSETTEDLHPTAKENSMLLEVSQSTDHFGDVGSHAAVEIPFLCETTNDHQSKEKEAIELTPSTVSCEDASHEQKDTALPVDVCSLPCTLSDIHCVPVLVRETETKLPSPWEVDSLLAETLRGWAPEDCQEPSWRVNEADKRERVSECDRDSVPSQSLPQTHISCYQKCDIERLLDCHSCSPKSHHSSASEHSSQKCAPRELCILSPRSPHRQEQESRSPNRKKQRLRSPHRQEQRSRSPNRKKQGLRSPHRQEQNSRSPNRKKQRLRSPHRREQRSRSFHSCKQSPHRRERSSGSLQRVRDDFGRRYYPYCDCKHSCSLSLENSWERDLSPCYLPSPINCHHSPKESSKTCKMPHPYSPESHTVIQMTANSEDTGSPGHPKVEEETSSPAISWTLKDLSSAVLAKKEEIEEAYLQVLLNFAGVAIMLVEKEPGMQEAVDSALRANLRRIGDYYEHMLKNYIDSLAEAS